MLDKFLGYGLPYVIYSVEGLLFLFLLRHGQWKRQLGVWLYVFSLVAVDGGIRHYVLHHYGLHSDQYAFCYWISDVILTLGAFALVCSFFRRACKQMETWHIIRLSLIVVFILVTFISFFSLFRNYQGLLHSFKFIEGFEQNLCFACLVLNTLVYIMLQQNGNADERLGLFVCGMGIQFAGPTASLALLHVTLGQRSVYSLFSYIVPFCTLAMLLVWFFAVSGYQASNATNSRYLGARHNVPSLAEAGGFE
jgi:hypothetical protein